ncbi:MAG: thioredoxin-dependent thiol peroxidase [Lentisphaeria bacterium]|nr:thioredoxin-dependent thiol peroxidase [Lentisphaeria bacterium]
MPSSSIKSKKDLLEEIGIALNSHGMEEKFFLDLTIQDIVPYPEDILEPGYRYSEFDTSLSKEEIQEVRKKHRLIEIDAIPSHIGFRLMEEFAEQHDNEWLFRALKKQHPFATFRNAVERANLLDQWYAFRDEAYGKQAQEWLDDNGIDFVDDRIIQLKEWKINHGEHIMNIGEYAPDFTLQDKDGKTVSLSDFKGRKVVLYFYPKDNTPGCTRQAIGFAENYNEFQKRNITVIGISKDSVESHVKFAKKNNLPFILLSDPELKAIQDYGVWQEKKLYGKVSMGIVRTTFIINEEGIIQDIMRKVKPDTNAEDVLAKFK